jgi:hypothetical protein
MGLQIISRALFISTLIFCTRAVCAQDIRIAVVGSMTGPLAESGDENKRGAELAAKDINAGAASTAEGLSSALRTTPAIRNKPFQSPIMSSVSRSPLWTATPARTLLFLLPQSMPSIACL